MKAFAYSRGLIGEAHLRPLSLELLNKNALADANRQGKMSFTAGM